MLAPSADVKDGAAADVGVVVRNSGNPVGEAIVWWNAVANDEDQTGIFIRCFVPADGV